MVPKEGYFKFTPEYVGDLGPVAGWVDALNQWRDKLYDLRLIGQYAEGELKGIGYGNISLRTAGGFLITATRTGGLPRLGRQHYTEIVRVDLDRNSVEFRAVSPAVTPSAESMTHGMFYLADPEIQAVIHVHHLEFWRRLMNVFPTTARNVEYGTPEMAREILRLYRESDLPARKIAVMGGHEEGIVSFGQDLNEAGTLLLEAFRRSGFGR
jgi:L-ribulose-5-phosphate 4-epimerase